MKYLWIRYVPTGSLVGTGWHRVSAIDVDSLEKGVLIFDCVCGTKIRVDGASIGVTHSFSQQFAKIPNGVGMCKTCTSR